MNGQYADVIVCHVCGTVLMKSAHANKGDFAYCPTCARSNGSVSVLRFPEDAQLVHREYDKQEYYPSSTKNTYIIK